MPILVVRDEEREDRFALTKGVHTIGRSLDCDIRIRDVKSSRRHCRLTIDAKGAHVVDLSSNNGTYLNGHLLDREELLKPGDRIEIGKTSLVYMTGGEDTATRVPGTELATAEERKAADKITSRVPAKKSQRYIEEAGRKRIPPLAIFLGLTAVALAVVTVLIFRSVGGDSPENDRAEAQRRMSDAMKHARRGDADAAIASYREALGFCERHKELGQLAASVRRSILELETLKADRERARQEWDRVKPEVEQSASWSDLLLLKDLQDKLRGIGIRHAALQVGWAGEIDAALEKVQERYDFVRSEQQAVDFAAAQQRIRRAFRIGDNAGDFAGALRAWDEVRGKRKELKLDDEPRIAQELETIDRRATEALSAALRNAAAARQEGGKGAARKSLEADLPRFLGCSAEKELRAKIEELARE